MLNLSKVLLPAVFPFINSLNISAGRQNISICIELDGNADGDLCRWYAESFDHST